MHIRWTEQLYSNIISLLGQVGHKWVSPVSEPKWMHFLKQIHQCQNKALVLFDCLLLGSNYL